MKDCFSEEKVKIIKGYDIEQKNRDHPFFLNKLTIFSPLRKSQKKTTGKILGY